MPTAGPPDPNHAMLRPVTESESPEQPASCGMRGEIPASRMTDIQSELPSSYVLRKRIPNFKTLLIGAPLPGTALTKHYGLLRLVDGWHMLNQARMALIEAEACKVFYEEVKLEPDLTEAKYRSRFYLDDAALRLCSSLEHLLRFTRHYWDLRPMSATGKREPLLVRVIQAAENGRSPAAKPLRKLRSSERWRECAKYRNDWVHNKIPGVAGLSNEISFRNVSGDDLKIIGQLRRKEKHTSPRGGKKIAFGTGREFDDLRRIIRGAYADLFDTLQSLLTLVEELRPKQRGSP